MLEQNLLDDISKISLRKPFHLLFEITLVLGHSLLFSYCFYQMSLIGFVSVDAIEEFIFILLSTLAIGYIYSWHRFSTEYDNNIRKALVPVYLNPLRFLSFFVSSFLGFIAFLFVNFKAYKFDATLETAELITFFFAFLGVIQFIYTLLTPTKTTKKAERKS